VVKGNQISVVGGQVFNINSSLTLPHSFSFSTAFSDAPCGVFTLMTLLGEDYQTNKTPPRSCQSLERTISETKACEIWQKATGKDASLTAAMIPKKLCTLMDTLLLREGIAPHLVLEVVEKLLGTKENVLAHDDVQEGMFHLILKHGKKSTTEKPYKLSRQHVGDETHVVFGVRQ
jgi:hypothetical protein